MVPLSRYIRICIVALSNVKSSVEAAAFVATRSSPNDVVGRRTGYKIDDHFYTHAIACCIACSELPLDVRAADAAPPPPATKRRRATAAAADVVPALVAGVAFMCSYFPLGMKHINSQFIHVSANAAFRVITILIPTCFDI